MRSQRDADRLLEPSSAPREVRSTTRGDGGSPRVRWKARALAAEKTVAVLKRRVEALVAGTATCSIGSQLEAIERRARKREVQAAVAAREAAEKKHADQFARHDAMCQEFMESLLEDVRAGTEHIQAILDNVGSGLLLVGPDRRIARGWSKSCSQLLGDVNPTGMRLADALGLSGGDAEDFELGLEQILDDILPEELTLAQARSRVAVEDRTLGLTYGAVRKDGAVSAVLVTLTDVTAQIVAENAARSATALLDIRKQLPVFRMFVDDARRLLREAHELVELGDVVAVRRAVHTIKGNASVHELVELVGTAHTVESQSTIGSEDIRRLEETLEAFLTEHRDVLGDLDSTDASTDEVVVSEARLRELVEHCGGDVRTLSTWLNSRRFVPAGKLVAALKSSARRVAARLEKDVDVVVIGANVELDPRRLAGVIGTLSHLVRNAVDHGLETGEQRGRKDPTGKLTLSFEDLPNAWRISVKDDGRGIDPARVAAAAAARGIDAKPRSVAEAVEVLCMPGFSTAEQVTDISGRGVGLPAVKQALADLGGELFVRSAPGEGTEVEMLCPKAA